MSSALVQKTVLHSLLVSLFTNLAIRDMPQNRREIEEDKALNQKLLGLVREIRGHRYFKDIILTGKTHRDFLDGWEELEQFAVRWTLPYELLSPPRWAERISITRKKGPRSGRPASRPGRGGSAGHHNLRRGAGGDRRYLEDAREAKVEGRRGFVGEENHGM